MFLDILFDDPAEILRDNQQFAAYGGYRGIMSRAFPEGVMMTYFNPALGGANAVASWRDILPSAGFDGIVVGGSTIDIGPGNRVYDWQETLWSLIRWSVRWRIPVLGICGGHQYGARALTRRGDTVTLNPMGRNFGTSPVTLTQEGRVHPLFAGLGEEIICQWSHRYVVNELASDEFDFTVLGSHPKTKQAVFQCQSFVGLQFHPEFVFPESEFGAAIMRILAESRRKVYEDEGLLGGMSWGQFLESRILPAQASGQIIRNWIAMITSGYFQQRKSLA